ncbi:hypothetical protein BDN71DRAFT_1509999 [Pleurotus eryngii]|uniref:Uncharacterized protein n=1 Tax=Pleurotus eryngii TaxID=5323 RepID=A0A9P5ZQ24_PLEER|nr:hypothetical protein BDN71DRAFT_1509999 [Pleurotus eryngii]
MKTVKSVPTSTILAIMINSAYMSTAPNSHRTTTTTSTMTLLLIVSTLLASPQKHAERCALVAAAEDALTNWKGWIEAALGYNAAQVDEWIIVNGRHASRSSRRQHATLRAYMNGQPVATMHIYIKGTKSRITDVHVWPNGGAMTSQATSLIAKIC